METKDGFEERFDEKFPIVYTDKAEDWTGADISEKVKDFIRAEKKLSADRVVEFLKDKSEMVMTDTLWYVYKDDFESARSLDNS